jgi:membrane protease subunit HflK
MPWNNQSGGGWKSGGGGGPWGQGGGGNQQPDLEEIFKRGQERLKQVIPGGGFGGGFIALLLVLAVAAWFASGLYIVRANEVALNLVFGKFTGRSQEGLNYNWPAPIGQVIKVAVTEIKLTQVGNTGGGRPVRGTPISGRETLMLTGDGNIIDISFDVQWQVDAAKVVNYVFNLKNPEETVRAVAESAMREVVGKRELQPIINDRGPLVADAQKLIQDTLNGYGAGINIVSLQLKIDPPAEVVEAFNSVPKAQQEQVRLQNVAETYRNRVVPEAKGQAAKIVQDAEAYRQRSVAEAQGQASRFTQVLEEYKRAPDVTRQRLYLETMERVYSAVDKTIIDSRIGNGVLPYLSVDRRSPASASRPDTGSTK